MNWPQKCKEEMRVKFIYPAVFRKTEDGGYQGYFPDLECCYAKGDTLEEAVDDANEAARCWLTGELEEDDWEPPPVSDVHDLELEEGDVVRNIAVTIRFYEGWDE